MGAPATIEAAGRDGVELRRPTWGLSDVAITMLAAILVPIAIIGALLVTGLKSTGAPILILAGSLPWIALAGWPILTTRMQGNGFRLDLGYRFVWTDIWLGLAGAVVAFGLALPVEYLTRQLFGEFDSAAGLAALESGAPRWVLVLFAVMVVIGSPLCEEMAFRGLAFAAIAKYIAGRGRSEVRIKTWAVVVSSALFAAIHLEPVRFPLLFVIGLVLGYLRARTDRVGASVAAHAFNNLPGAITIALIGV